MQERNAVDGTTSFCPGEGEGVQTETGGVQGLVPERREEQPVGESARSSISGFARSYSR